jgi:hypothetical protein
MSTYLYSKWRKPPIEGPFEFYSELDADRWEMRKVEVFRGGHLGHASSSQSAGGTCLAIVPVPPFQEMDSQVEFEVKTISRDEFEAVWKCAAA